MTIYCCCGNPNCHKAITISDGGSITFINEGKEYMMYLDANSIVKVIRALQKEMVEILSLKVAL